MTEIIVKNIHYTLSGNSVQSTFAQGKNRVTVQDSTWWQNRLRMQIYIYAAFRRSGFGIQG